jgi:hypothetical protein
MEGGDRLGSFGERLLHDIGGVRAAGDFNRQLGGSHVAQSLSKRVGDGPPRVGIALTETIQQVRI